MPGSHGGIDERAAALLGQYCGIFEALSDGLIINDLETGAVVEVNFADAAEQVGARLDGGRGMSSRLRSRHRRRCGHPRPRQ